MKSNPNGWKRRQQRAQQRMTDKNSPERQEIRAARAAHYRGEVYTAPVQVAAPASVDDMDWKQLANEARRYGSFVPPKIKLETLRDKVRGLRNEEGAEADETQDRFEERGAAGDDALSAQEDAGA